MNDETAFERFVTDRIADSGRVTARPGAADRIITQARRSRPSPRWLAILKEPPMRHASRVVVGSPTARVAAFAAVTLLLATLGAGALVAGAQSPSPAPPEDASVMEPAWVTGTAGSGTTPPPSRTEFVDGVVYEYHYPTEGTVPIEMSDPRLTGTVSAVWTLVKHFVSGDDTIRAFTGEYLIENEGGSWEGTMTGMERGSGPWHTVTDTGVLVGSGDYEGLTAYLIFDWTYSLPEPTVTGAIFPGELPPQVTFEDWPED
jgi:hypothetical protein